MRRIIATFVITLLGAAVLAACGGSDHDSMDGMNGMDHGSTEMKNRARVPGARELAVTGDSLAFDPERLEVRAGEDVTIVLTAKDLDHDLTVEGIGHVVHASAGSTAKGGLVVDKPGVYEFWCTVRGHKAGGMVGTITVAS